VAFTWHPGSAPERASYVEVTFTATKGGTLVILEHSGWEVFDYPASARDDYSRGWPKVLELYGDQVSHQADGETWVALVHSPGPRAPQTGSCSTILASQTTSHSSPVCAKPGISPPPGRSLTSQAKV
jgi:hypothetical protein